MKANAMSCDSSRDRAEPELAPVQNGERWNGLETRARGAGGPELAADLAADVVEAEQGALAGVRRAVPTLRDGARESDVRAMEEGDVVFRQVVDTREPRTTRLEAHRVLRRKHVAVAR